MRHFELGASTALGPTSVASLHVSPTSGPCIECTGCQVHVRQLASSCLPVVTVTELVRFCAVWPAACPWQAEHTGNRAKLRRL